MGTENSEVTGGLDAFALGVESVNPGAKVHVSVTHSWFDPAGEAMAARALLESGCDVISQHSDSSAPLKEAQRAGKWGIGYNSDMRREAPGAVLTSVIWNWGVYYTGLTRSVINGTFTTKPYFGGLAEGLVGLAPLEETLIAPGTVGAVQAAMDRVRGGFNVFDGVMETNDGRRIGVAGGTLPDSEIQQGINWYYRNIIAQ
jgi:basic membrane protein A